MANDFDNKGFKLADNYLPPLFEGIYNVKVDQHVKKPEEQHFSINKQFCVTLNTETLSDDAVFNVHPAPNQQGPFSTVLPFMVFNNVTYPWMKELKDSKGNVIPWLALIVVSENEICKDEKGNPKERNIEYSLLEEEKNNTESNVFFPYTKNEYSPCQPHDNVHLITVSKVTFDSIKPTKEDRFWLTHSKKIDLSDVDDATIPHDGFFSVVMANRFPPSGKSTVHLIAAYNYDDENAKATYTKIKEDKSTENIEVVLKNAEYVKLISLYHWDIYSDSNTEDKSFDYLVENLAGPENNRRSQSVMEQSLKSHYLRQTGEKTYSLYHGPIQPMNYKRIEYLNGEKKFTADGRLIYNKNNGIFDVSYSAAFNLGKLVTLSHNKEAQQIVKWRKEKKTNEHMDDLKINFGISNHHVKDDLTTILKNMKEEYLDET